jgi:hypothetical protein
MAQAARILLAMIATRVPNAMPDALMRAVGIVWRQGWAGEMIDECGGGRG